jgi:hypothetical protein
VAEEVLGAPKPSTWGDRLFRAVPIAPGWIGLGLAVVWMGGLVVFANATGLIDQLRRFDQPLWAIRDARLAILFVILAAYVPTACQYVRLRARVSLDELRPSLALDGASYERICRSFDRLDPRSRRIAAFSALGTVPVVALLVDLEPSLYLQAFYWGPERVLTLGVGGVVAWNMGVFAYLTGAYARRFSELALSVKQIDLFDLAPLAPFGRQGLRSALLGLIFLAVFGLNLVDQGFLWVFGILGTFSLVGAILCLALPARGVHQRLRQAKLEELDRVHRAIRGEQAALSGSAISPRADTVGLADLIAYRGLVESVREWPFDPSTLIRFVLYLGIPVVSWLGGALVERLVETALD